MDSHPGPAPDRWYCPDDEVTYLGPGCPKCGQDGVRAAPAGPAVPDYDGEGLSQRYNLHGAAGPAVRSIGWPLTRRANPDSLADEAAARTWAEGVVRLTGPAPAGPAVDVPAALDVERERAAIHVERWPDTEVGKQWIGDQIRGDPHKWNLNLTLQQLADRIIEVERVARLQSPDPTGEPE